MLNVFETPDQVLQALAEYFVIIGNEAIAKNKKFSVALSGGSSPKKLYELLATEFHDKLDWEKVYFFFGDERYVPQDHKDSNYLMARNALFAPLLIEPGHIFAVDTSLEPKEAAKKYQEEIEDFFDEDEQSFDLILLGLGDNSHTASLFPHTPVLHDRLPGVSDVWLEDQQVYRITMNAPLINEAQNIAFLVYGEGKAEAVHHILEDDEDIEEYPAQLIEPIVGNIQWFLDEAAAAKVRHS
ncbi:6-phosphogluconolactonase [Mucilaginibacter sp. L3T2-6]|uniref:6-phosphogluconolactonase n=1 Tax=Mucilaginibacter sp. L3T2-6 TaxID=3062491 RepID=UPI0026756298|nr:6-phosphogluconolactonase [Mucilaginibacter sp. L3T2-6]MDO3643588.1 6-phosphogluconolactonase [Mucilaginibacter sp. L3T2-6]MDV6216039.1 6-phosphogluconolactonase [Mucilaginibacter sp. L3T2-6]